MFPVMGILRRSENDRSVRDRKEKRRSEYSDLVLAEQFPDHEEILEKIKVRPRLASPAPREVTRMTSRPSMRRVKRRQKRLRWSDAGMGRSVSSDHLANMRSSCHCSCEPRDQGVRRGLSLSVGNLCDMEEECEENLVRVKSEECVKNLVKSEDHVYVNCDAGDHLEAYNSLMRILMLQEDGKRPPRQNPRRRKPPRKTSHYLHLSPGCISAEFILKVYFLAWNGSIKSVT